MNLKAQSNVQYQGSGHRGEGKKGERGNGKRGETKRKRGEIQGEKGRKARETEGEKQVKQRRRGIYVVYICDNRLYFLMCVCVCMYVTYIINYDVLI